MKRQGFVRVREELRVELPWHRYTASWQPDPEGRAGPFYSEDGPGWNDVEEAIEWARRHAPVVYVRRGPGLREMYNAGEQDDHGRHPTPRWPKSRRRRAASVHPDYAGIVWVDEEQPSYFPSGRYSAVWASESEDLLGEADDFEDVEAAIDWGRERAPVVVVAETPISYVGVPTYPTYEIRSAGDEDPPGDPLERIRPRAGQATMEWAFSTQEAVRGEDDGAFREQLESALRKDDTISEPVCELQAQEPRAWSVSVFAEGDDVSAMPDLEPIGGWIDVSFRVSAPTRKRAFEIAFAALHRALFPDQHGRFARVVSNFQLSAIS